VACLGRTFAVCPFRAQTLAKSGKDGLKGGRWGVVIRRAALRVCCSAAVYSVWYLSRNLTVINARAWLASLARKTAAKGGARCRATPRASWQEKAV